MTATNDRPAPHFRGNVVSRELDAQAMDVYSTNGRPPLCQGDHPAPTKAWFALFYEGDDGTRPRFACHRCEAMIAQQMRRQQDEEGRSDG